MSLRRAAALAPDLDRHRPLVDHALEDGEHGGLARRRRFTRDGRDLVERAQVRLRREGTLRHFADHRLETRDALHQQDPVREDREHEVCGRTREQHRDARKRRPAIERAMRILGRHRAVAFVEQAHVAAERDCGEHVLHGVRIAAHAPDQRLAEADGKAQHLESEPASDPVMAELVHRHEDADGDDERDDGSEDG